MTLQIEHGLPEIVFAVFSKRDKCTLLENLQKQLTVVNSRANVIFYFFFIYFRNHSLYIFSSNIGLRDRRCSVIILVRFSHNFLRVS